MYLLSISGESIRAFRLEKRESVERFWARFGIAKVEGASFEAGKDLPLATKMLLALWLDDLVSDHDLASVKRRIEPTRAYRDHASQCHNGGVHRVC